MTAVRPVGERRQLIPRGACLDRPQLQSGKVVILGRETRIRPCTRSPRWRQAGSHAPPKHRGVAGGRAERREISLLPLQFRDFDPDTRRGAMNHKSPAGCVHLRSGGGVAMLIRHKYYPRRTKLL